MYVYKSFIKSHKFNSLTSFFPATFLGSAGWRGRGGGFILQSFIRVCSATWRPKSVTAENDRLMLGAISLPPPRPKPGSHASENRTFLHHWTSRHQCIVSKSADGLLIPGIGFGYVTVTKLERLLLVSLKDWSHWRSERRSWRSWKQTKKVTNRAFLFVKRHWNVTVNMKQMQWF